MALLLGTVVLGVGMLWGLGAAVLGVALLVLLGAIWLLWSSLLGLVGDTQLSLEEALTLTAPSAEEEQKRAVLRALKDLEFEHSVGKISEEDYLELRRRYRAEAMRLLKLVDEAQAASLQQAERLVERHLRKETQRKELLPKEIQREETLPKETQQPLRCQSCGKRNDLDAKFCKSCGAKLARGEGS